MASTKTIIEVTEILTKYLSHDEATAMVRELRKVPGSLGFREAIVMIGIQLALKDHYRSKQQGD